MTNFEQGDILTTLSYVSDAPYVTGLQHYRTDGTRVRELGVVGDVSVGRIGIDADFNVYHLVFDSGFENRIEKFSIDGSHIATFSSDVSGISTISAFAVDQAGQLYFAHPANGSDPDDHIYKYSAPGDLIGLVDDALTGPSSVFVNDIDVRCDGCQLLIVTNRTPQIARADGCALSPLADFANPADATNDNVAICWLPDGGAALATQRRGIVRYDATGAVLWETGFGDARGWSGIDVDQAGASLWACTWMDSGTFPTGTVNRITQFDIETGAVVFEFTPVGTVDGGLLQAWGVCVVRRCVSARRTMLASIVG